MTPTRVISVQDLSVVLGSHRILDGISFDIQKGDVAVIIGPNGSGKTTLLKALLGFIPFEGKANVLGVAPACISEVALKIGYVPQKLDFDRTVPITVFELLKIYAHTSRVRAIHETALLVGIEHLLHQRLAVLSGGEFQRTLLALALINDPEILFLDEPVASIDIEGAGEVYALIETLREKRDITVLMVSHDVDIVFHYATTVLCINHRLLCKGAPRDALSKDVIDQLYGGHEAFYAHEEKQHRHHPHSHA